MSKSFLQRLLEFYKHYDTIQVGKESISIEAKDLFINAYYNYINSHFDNFNDGINTLSHYGIEKKSSVSIVKEKDNSFSLIIRYNGNKKKVPHIEKIFEDDKGIYNKKGYYDDNTVKKFNMLMFKIFDEIADISKNKE